MVLAEMQNFHDTACMSVCLPCSENWKILENSFGAEVTPDVTGWWRNLEVKRSQVTVVDNENIKIVLDVFFSLPRRYRQQTVEASAMSATARQTNGRVAMHKPPLMGGPRGL